MTPAAVAGFGPGSRCGGADCAARLAAIAASRRKVARGFMVTNTLPFDAVRLRTVLRFANPRYIWNGRAGFCPICNGRTYFLVTCPPELLRNDAFCVRCGSVARQRHVALAIAGALRALAVRTVGDLAGREDIDVWHTSTRGAIAKALQPRRGEALRLHAPVLTEYLDDVSSGDTRDGVLCQDIQATTFADARFDLVITEDVLEHVTDFRRAFREIRRVLKPGGCHVFTVPYYPDEPTRPLFERRDGADVPLGPIEYHDDALRGLIATRTRFGADLADLAAAAGFDLLIKDASADDVARYATFNCTTFVATRR